jgi:ribosome assembly protein 1
VPITDTQLVTFGDQIKTEKQDKQEQSNEHVFIAFARVFSGTVKRGQELYVLGPKHEPQSALEKVQHSIIIPLFSC